MESGGSESWKSFIETIKVSFLLLVAVALPSQHWTPKSKRVPIRSPGRDAVREAVIVMLIPVMV